MTHYLVNPIVKLKLIILYLLFATPAIFAAPIKVSFINPTTPNEEFWGMVTEFMQAVAQDLDIEVSVYYSQHSRHQSLELAKQILSAPTKPNYLVFMFQEQVGPRILEAAENANVYSFTINTGIPEADRLKIGLPRGKYRYWLGHMFPDDGHAGFVLSSTLAKMAIQQGKRADDGNVHIIGLTGSYDSTAAQDRNKGMQHFVDQRSDVRLRQLVYARWNREHARIAASTLLSRYPGISVIWAASDNMSFGAIDAIEQRGLRPGVDVFTGGVDGTQRAINAVISGEMTATIAGHFMEGGWAMILLHDHYHGIDFAEKTGTTIRSKMDAITSANVQSYTHSYTRAHWDKVDFKRFSKKFNTDERAYHFKLPNKALAD